MKNKIIAFFIFFTLIISSNSYAFTSLTIWNNLETEAVNSQPIENYLNLESESAILLETQTGQILFEKNPHEEDETPKKSFNFRDAFDSKGRFKQKM